MVHSELVPGLSKRYKGVEDLGVKKGPFYVLFLSSIPSILVESGFLTNEHDAKLLRQRAYLELAADHIAAGVARFREAGARFAARPSGGAVGP
jgi:N-acetylmuramoyl-L-alanine amidase